MTTTTNHPEFDVEASTHSHCTRCAEAANSAATMAAVTGSRGSTFSVVHDNGVEHRATVRRVRCNAGRSDCCCPVCAAVRARNLQPEDPFDGLDGAFT